MTPAVWNGYIHLVDESDPEMRIIRCWDLQDNGDELAFIVSSKYTGSLYDLLGARVVLTIDSDGRGPA